MSEELKRIEIEIKDLRMVIIIIDSKGNYYCCECSELFVDYNDPEFKNRDHLLWCAEDYELIHEYCKDNHIAKHVFFHEFVLDNSKLVAI